MLAVGATGAVAALWLAYETKRGGPEAAGAAREELQRANLAKVRRRSSRIRACRSFCSVPSRPLLRLSHSSSYHQAYETVLRGNFSLSEAQRQELVTREAPLKELKGIVECKGIDKSYFVVTGVFGWHSVL